MAQYQVAISKNNETLYFHTNGRRFLKTKPVSPVDDAELDIASAEYTDFWRLMGFEININKITEATHAA